MTHNRTSLRLFETNRAALFEASSHFWLPKHRFSIQWLFYEAPFNEADQYHETNADEQQVRR